MSGLSGKFTVTHTKGGGLTTMRKTTLYLMALGVLLGGCASYNKAMYGEGPASEAWTECSKQTFGESLIPDFGITHKAHFSKCMAELGWEQTPGMPDGNRWGPTAYRRIGGAR